MIIGHLGEVFYDYSLNDRKRLLVMRYIGKCFWVLVGLDLTDEWGPVVPVLQFAPIIYPKCYKLPQ